MKVRPGGNQVHSYLDVLAPDDATPAEIDMALTGLWLELSADEMGPASPQGALPNPLVCREGRVVLRFGVEDRMLENRAMEMADLRRVVDVAVAARFDLMEVKLGA